MPIPPVARQPGRPSRCPHRAGALVPALVALLVASGCARHPAPARDPVVVGSTATDTGRAILVRAPVGPIGDSAPRFPGILRSADVEGTIVADLLIDTAGRVVPGSLRRVQQTHELFVVAVRRVLPHWRFEPARYAFAAAHGRREMPSAAAHRVTVSFRIVRDSSALAACRQHAPYTSVCALSRRVIARSVVH